MMAVALFETSISRDDSAEKRFSLDGQAIRFGPIEPHCSFEIVKYLPLFPFGGCSESNVEEL